MLDIKLVRQNPGLIRKGLEDRGGRFVPAFDELLEVDGEWLQERIPDGHALTLLRRMNRKIGYQNPCRRHTGSLPAQTVRAARATT